MPPVRRLYGVSVDKARQHCIKSQAAYGTCAYFRTQIVAVGNDCADSYIQTVGNLLVYHAFYEHDENFFLPCREKVGPAPSAAVRFRMPLCVVLEEAFYEGGLPCRGIEHPETGIQEGCAWPRAQHESPVFQHVKFIYVCEKFAVAHKEMDKIVVCIADEIFNGRVGKTLCRGENISKERSQADR